MEANGDNLLLGRGKLFFDRFDTSGVSTGLRFLGDCNQFEITPSVQSKERFDSSKAANGKIASGNINQTHKITIQMGEYQPDNLAMALLGDTYLLTQATAGIVGEHLTTSVKKGRLYQTVKRGISAYAVKKGATVLVEGTDYEVQDATLGLIHILPTGVTLTDGDAVDIDYTCANITGLTRVKGGTVSKITGKLVFVGDPAGGPVYDGEFWKVQFSPNGAVALITDDYGNIPLTGECLQDTTNHATEPFYRVTQRAIVSNS